MFSRKRVKHSGATGLSVGDLVTDYELSVENDKAKTVEAKSEVDAIVMGIAEVSLSRKVSCQRCFPMDDQNLDKFSIRGNRDKLVGLKENVIIGR